MASWDHEGIIELFRSDPRLAADLLRSPLGTEIVAALSKAARKAFQMHPQGAQFFDESQRESFDRGRAAEKAAAVLDVLDARGLSITDAQREGVLDCKDLEILSRWLRRAATITSADALFE